MAIDFEWNGKRWEARKVRRKLTPHEHKGVPYYDRERMRQPLSPIVHSREFDGYPAAPTWAAIPQCWGEWEATPAGYFHQNGSDGNQPADDLDDPPIAQTDDYTLERCHVVTVCSYRNPERHRPGRPEFIQRPALYRWELTFADGAVFRFVSRAIAEAALSELVKIRKAKHPRPKYGKHSSETACVFFTNRKLHTLAENIRSALSAEVALEVDNAA
jgi:hypothetical protein